MPEETNSKEFITATTQAVDCSQAERIMGAIDTLETLGSVSELINLLRIPAKG